MATCIAVLSCAYALMPSGPAPRAPKAPTAVRQQKPIVRTPAPSVTAIPAPPVAVKPAAPQKRALWKPDPLPFQTSPRAASAPATVARKVVPAPAAVARKVVPAPAAIARKKPAPVAPNKEVRAAAKKPASPAPVITKAVAAPVVVAASVAPAAPGRQEVESVQVAQAKAPQSEPQAPLAVEEREEDSEVAVDTKIEQDLEQTDSEEAFALDVVSPLDEVAARAFDEYPETSGYSAELSVSSLQLDPQVMLDRDLPREQAIVAIEGRMQRNDFAPWRARIAALKGELENMGDLTAPAAPRAEAPVVAVTAPAVESSKATPVKEAELASAPALEAGGANQLIKPASPAKPVASAVQKPVTSAARKPEPKTEAVAQSIRAPEAQQPEVVEEHEEVGPGELAVVAAPKLAGVTTLPVPQPPSIQVSKPLAVAKSVAGAVATQAMPTRTLDARIDLPTKGQTPMPAPAETPVADVKPAPPSEAAPIVGPELVVPSQTVAENRTASRATEPLISEPAGDGGTVFGQLDLDAPMAEWLTQQKGHVELYLHPIKSREPQDTIFLDYQYPDSEFEFDVRGLKGWYKLVAGIYVPKSSTPVARLSYPEAISVDNYKKRIRFLLRKDAFDNASAAGQVRPGLISLTATLFEGATGNFREPRPIRGGRVRILGFPEAGIFVSDTDGNIRIPSVPRRSSLLLEVSADGYYNAYPVVPTFGTNVYAPIYLISKDKVDAVTRFFTRNPQDPRRGIVFGRIFDSATRTPAAGERLSLSFRKGKALYFSALPDPTLDATTDTGLFAFFNITPSFRSLARESGKPGYLLNVRPNSALYVELGRGGKKTLMGKLVDPFHKHLPLAQVRVVGAPQLETITDSSGTFRFEGVDFPPGVLTVEVEAEGYPTTWHTLSWSTRERDSVRSMFLMDKELINEAASRIAKLKLRHDRGTVVGGAETTFFPKDAACLFVTLENAGGEKIADEAGPFPLSGERQPKAQPLCLTAQRPGFAFYNLPSGEYILKWKSQQGATLRTRVLHVGVDRVTVSVN